MKEWTLSSLSYWQRKIGLPAWLTTLSTWQNVMQWRTKNRSGILWTQSGAADYIFSVIFFFIVSDGFFWSIEVAYCVFSLCSCTYVCVCARVHSCINIWLHVTGVKDSSKLNIKVISITLNWHFWHRAQTFIQSDSEWQTENCIHWSSISYNQHWECKRQNSCSDNISATWIYSCSSNWIIHKAQQQTADVYIKTHILLNPNVVKTNQALTIGYDCDGNKLKVFMN